MNSHHTIVDLATVAIVLPAHAHRMSTALSRARLIDAADRLRVGVISDDDLLAVISELFFIPLDRFEKALQGSWSGFEQECDGFDVFAVQVR